MSTAPVRLVDENGNVYLRQDAIVRCGVMCLVYRWNPETAWYKLLLTKRARSHGAGTWSMPGGWIDYGEAALDAVAREVWEEVGIEVPTRNLEFLTYTEDLFEEDGKDCLTLFFRVFLEDNHVIEEPLQVDRDEVSDYMWLNLDTGADQPTLPTPLFLPIQNFIDNGNEI